LLVLGETQIRRESKTYRKIVVKCLECAKDPVLNKEAIYQISPNDIERGRLPCKCSPIPRYTQEQWKVILNRKADLRNYTISYTDENLDQNVKLNIYCGNCQNSWNTCSVGNFMRDRTCPKCSIVSKSKKKMLPDSVHISDFFATGVFKEGTIFENTKSNKRLWKVICPRCPDKEFFSDKSNLKAGKVPCDCNSGGGFDKRLDGYVYVLKAESAYDSFVGFGITNFPKRRLKDHEREVRKLGYKIIDYVDFKFDGVTALKIESKLRNNFELYSQRIPGFITEATYSFNHLKMIEFVKGYDDS